MNIVVSNSAQFRGTIMYRPYIKNTFSNQEGVETFNLDLDVVNPNNPTQTRNIGKMTGRVPIVNIVVLLPVRLLLIPV